MTGMVERGDCPMRHENGNCTAAGGFCTAVNDPICEALHNAFDCGKTSVLRKIAKGKQPCEYCNGSGKKLPAFCEWESSTFNYIWFDEDGRALLADADGIDILIHACPMCGRKLGGV